MTTKTAINHKFSLKNVFQEVLYRIDNSINERCGWIVKLIESQYINISAHRPLSERSYIKLPVELRSSEKDYSHLKILRRSNSLIANNTIRNVILEIKNHKCKIVKILIFRSLSREHFQNEILEMFFENEYFENVLRKDNEILVF